jgi:hypothetical protein
VLSVVALGHLAAESITPLLDHFEKVEVLQLDVPPRDDLAKHRAELNRTIDAAANDWLLIVRERETVDAALAAEIRNGIDAAKVRGFRIRTIPIYSGKPLRLGDPAGEVRLFHRRSYMRYANKGEWTHITIQGTVVRMQHAFRATTFASSEEHRAWLAKTGVPHSSLRHLLLFLHHAVVTRAHDRNTLRYLWIEAAFDQH